MIRRIVFAAVAIAALSQRAQAQQTRTELLRTATAAYDDFAPERALDLLKAAVNPALGPTDSAWARGIHLLTQILVEAGNQDLGKAWSRWAARTAPDMKLDTVNFLAGVASALREARTFAARGPGDAVTQTSWRWVGRNSAETRGRILVEQGTMSVPVNARVVGGGLVPAGVGLSLAAGSYEIEAGAPGFLPARVTREVLPGVTTVLRFSLTSAAVASDFIAENVRQHTFRNAAALSVRRFGSGPSCAAGAFMSRDGLLLTSYQAIRGADSVALATGIAAQPIRVAAYDVLADLAVLRVPTTLTDSIAPAASIADGQSVWALRFADCRTPTETRARLDQWNDRPRGALVLSDAPAGAATGSLLVDVDGRLTGIWTGGTSGAAAPRAVTLLDQARRNVAANQLLALRDVSRRENHAYGSIAIASDVTTASVKLTPLETWHWAGLQAAGAAPFTFAGPMGRYRLEVTGAGDARREQEITLRPGVNERLVVNLRSVAVGPGATAPAVGKKRKKWPWILAAVGGGGAAALALGGGGGGGGGPPPPPPVTTGSISVSVPVNPP